MLLDVQKLLGYQLSLNHLAENTLGVKKSADGLVSLQWYKEGKIKLITGHCQQRVTLIRDLFLYGESKGHVKYKTKSGNIVKCPVDWKSILIQE